MSEQTTLFDERFLGRYAGPIISDPTTALVELVANAWDAYATEVNIRWPDQDGNITFSINDNGAGMTDEEFSRRWVWIDYNRIAYQGGTVSPPPGVAGTPRIVYGRNGKGRHAAFHFSSEYEVITIKDGRRSHYRVSRGTRHPIHLERIAVTDGIAGHGTEIRAIHAKRSPLSAAEVRSVLSTRFLANPAFKVLVNGISVTFEDIPPHAIRKIPLTVEDFGDLTIVAIDSQRADRTTKQHGIAWWVNGRLVGTWGWRLSDEVRVIDGRSEEAKRFTFIVQADFLVDSIKEDWSDFRDSSPAWIATEKAVQARIRDFIHATTAEKRSRTRDAVRTEYRHEVARLPPLSRERWNILLEEVTEKCPNISDTQISQIMGILSKLELSQSRYSLLEKLHSLSPDNYDQLNAILSDWTISTAKIALDEILRRLSLIEEIKNRISDEKTREVQDLQPLFKEGLWVFGPEFESIEYTSNEGMTNVIRKIFHAKGKGSRARPDFVVTKDGSVGLYALPSYDIEHNEDGISSLIIVDLKKPGVNLGQKEKNQIWGYVKELRSQGHLKLESYVVGYVLGSRIEEGENEPFKQGDFVTIRPMLYSTFVRRAEKRMLNLRERLLEAPFLKAAIGSFAATGSAEINGQAEMLLSTSARAPTSQAASPYAGSR